MQHLPVKLLRLLGRPEPEPGKRRAQPLVLLDRSGAVAGVRVHAHQRTLRRFIGRRFADHLLPQPGPTKQLEIEGANGPAALPGPVLVALVGQQLAPVATRNGRACLGDSRSQSQLALGLKTLNIDREAGARPQADLTPAKDDRLLRAQRRPRVMSSLAEVGGARVGRKVRPESVDDLLPLQPMPRRQREQLHELARAPSLPCLSGNATSIDRDLEPTEDADLDAKHTQRILPTTPADKDASTTRTPRWKRWPVGSHIRAPSAASRRPTSTKREAGRSCLPQLWRRSLAETFRRAACFGHELPHDGGGTGDCAEWHTANGRRLSRAP